MQGYGIAPDKGPSCLNMEVASIQDAEGGGHQAVAQPGRIAPVNPLLFVVRRPRGW